MEACLVNAAKQAALDYAEEIGEMPIDQDWLQEAWWATLSVFSDAIEGYREEPHHEAVFKAAVIAEVERLAGPYRIRFINFGFYSQHEPKTLREAKEVVRNAFFDATIERGEQIVGTFTVFGGFSFRLYELN